jgi:Domain of unknown function (DU1801)
MSPDVRAAFDAFPEPARAGLLILRDLIFQVAQDLPVEESLKWGQPAYRTPKGSTLRLGVPKTGGFALYAHCATNIIETFRATAGSDFRFEGNRAVLFTDMTDIKDSLRLMMTHALTYHDKRV